MQPLRPPAKFAIVLGGLLLAFIAAWAAMEIRSRANASDPSQGMQAFGDLVLGVVVFSVLSLPSIGFALYWLRPVTRFWTMLSSAAIAYALTGPVALMVSGPLRPALGGWAFLGDARIGTMPLSALAFATCTLFAPSMRLRWIFISAAFLDGLLFVGVVFVKFGLANRR